MHQITGRNRVIAKENISLHHADIVRLTVRSLDLLDNRRRYEVKNARDALGRLGSREDKGMGQGFYNLSHPSGRDGA